MKRQRVCRFLIAPGIFCFLIIMPFIGYSADLTISDSVTANGNWTLIGGMTATSFTGSGSGLSDVTASGLSCTGCVSPSHLNFTPGTITRVTAGTGLTGGGTNGSVTLNVNTLAIQSRVSSSCAAGSSIRIINSDGSVECQTDTNSGGTVTSVGTGAGLTGGPVTTAGTLSVDFAGSGSATTAARSDHNHDTKYQNKFGKVAVVAQSGGDYTDPVTAMSSPAIASWCGTPSATNPCLLKIMPGVYTIGTNSLQMQPYVDIEGSGENTTIVQGNPSSNCLMGGANNTELRFLTVKNTGVGTAICNTNASPKLTNMTAMASGTGANVSILNVSSSSPTMTNVTVTASGGSSNIGMSNDSSSPAMTNVTVTASGVGTSENDGVMNYSSSPIMNNVNVSASGGTSNCGVNNDSSSPTMTNVNVSVSGVGVLNIDSSPVMTNVTVTAQLGMLNGASSGSYTIVIDRSTFYGSTDSVLNADGYTLIVGATKFAGTKPDTTVGIYSCVGAYFFDGASIVALGADCQ